MVFLGMEIGMEAKRNYPQLILWDEWDDNMDTIVYFCILLGFSGLAFKSLTSCFLQCRTRQEAPIYHQLPPR